MCQVKQTLSCSARQLSTLEGPLTTGTPLVTLSSPPFLALAQLTQLEADIWLLLLQIDQRTAERCARR
jgi:hypothetical protein